MKLNVQAACWIISITLSLLSCTNPSTRIGKGTAESIHPDTGFIIGIAAQHLFDTERFPKEFADTNMMIIKSDTLPFNNPFKFCGKEAIFVKPELLTDSILLQVMNPKPFVELVSFKVLDDKYLIGLKFKTVGKKFDLILHEEQKNSYSINSVEETEF